MSVKAAEWWPSHSWTCLLLDGRLDTAAGPVTIVEQLKAGPETAGVRVVELAAELDVARALAGLRPVALVQGATSTSVR